MLRSFCLATLLAALALPVALPFPAEARSRARAEQAAPAPSVEGLCIDAHDGDTIKVQLDRRVERVRLIGIDTPEIGQGEWGLKARDFTRSLVLNQKVRLEFDVQPRDRYGRMLAYVYAGGRFVNLEVIRNGYAMLLTYPPNVAHTEEFTAAQKEAREKKLNIWSPQGGLLESPYEYRHKEKKRSHTQAE